MPELPEVEAVCRKLRPAVVDRKIVSADIRRCAPVGTAERVSGRSILAVARVGKHILIRLSAAVTLHVHLRMSGNLFAIPDHRFCGASARILFRLNDGSGMVLEDPRALARVEVCETAELDRALSAAAGPDPLTPAFTAAAFAGLARASRQPAKLFLMDQRRVSGLGNIYAAEALYRARVDPRKPIQRLTKPRLDRLHSAIVSVLSDAVQSAVSAYAGPGEFLEAESFPIHVYGREGEPCAVCRTPIRRISQGGRSTYFCPACQR
ncbi:MAG: bifunctional DNA-formamidopyrimidine glycosylase/DNA-(apurinic or apyrimidinic site) lyase [Acidobacteria bacterium]|nr:bifunctional DNA-formamidopyrimidine glycosylase/DNA-(apurinic or apyrimidinic site) lyase [Acidobacteriota bacterium]